MTLVARWRYRVGQVARAGAGGLTTREREEVALALPPPLLRLFLDMRGVAQRHGYNVYRSLLARSWSDPDLLAAALLHDVGKGHLGVISRVAWVLLGGASPVLRERLARHDFWGRWFGLRDNLCHPQAGAALAHGAGGSPITIWLIGHHEAEGHPDPVLRALQQADQDH
ncbi:MAG: hypothetical protein HYY02_09945 [Chloroflexi bacterium]|nr:hypothetical protein [Chloroflexota bacterium]